MFTAGFSVPFQIIRIPGFSRRVVEFHSGIFRAVEFYSWRWRAEEMTIGSKQSYNGSVMALTPRRKTSSRCAVEFSQLALADFPCRWIIAETLPIL